MATPLPARRAWPMISFLLVCVHVAHGAAGDPPPGLTYRTNSNEVRLVFSALDQNNHGVATLEASDFAVVDKDVIVREFQSFNRSDWTKLDLAILVDASGSVTPQFRKEIAGILQLVSETAGVPDENVYIFSFQGVRPTLLCAGDCRATHAAEQLPARQTGGLTPLFDAVVFASDFLLQHGDPHAQKVLIVFSDGEDTISHNSLTDAVATAVADEVQIYGVDLNSSGTTDGASVLYSLAGATGGRYFPPRDGATRTLNAILEGFRATYTVSYRLPSHASGFHAVRILPTHNLNLQFRSRSGYYYPNQVR